MIKELNSKNVRVTCTRQLRYLIAALSISFINFSKSAETLHHAIYAPELIDITKEKAALNPKGCTMQDMIQFYRKELGIKDAEIAFIKHRMHNPHTLGYTQPKGGHKYVIALARGLEPSELRIAIAHEL